MQIRAKGVSVKGDQNQAGASGEMLLQRPGDLIARGEVDKAIGLINGSPGVDAGGFSGAPDIGRFNLENQRCHAAPRLIWFGHGVGSTSKPVNPKPEFGDAVLHRCEEKWNVSGTKRCTRSHDPVKVVFLNRAILPTWTGTHAQNTKK